MGCPDWTQRSLAVPTGRYGVSLDENKDLIRRYIQAIDDDPTSDWSVLDEYIAEDFVAHNPSDTQSMRSPHVHPASSGLEPVERLRAQPTSTLSQRMA
jgi:hypothetical protein